jgi:hypothetical protein
MQKEVVVPMKKKKKKISFLGTPNSENIVQYFPSNWNLGFLEVYK